MDGDLATHALIKSPGSIKDRWLYRYEIQQTGRYPNLDLAMGTRQIHDTFSKAEVQYLDENDNWVTLKEPSYVWNESILKFENLHIKAKAVRMVVTEDRENTWFAVQEIAVNCPKKKHVVNKRRQLS